LIRVGKSIAENYTIKRIRILGDITSAFAGDIPQDRTIAEFLRFG